LWFVVKKITSTVVLTKLESGLVIIQDSSFDPIFSHWKISYSLATNKLLEKTNRLSYGEVREIFENDELKDFPNLKNLFGVAYHIATEE